MSTIAAEHTGAAAQRGLGAPGTRRKAHWVAVLASFVGAAWVYSRFSIQSGLSRDEAIYAYGGQRLAHGTPPYASIFDPKTPLASMICGLAAAVGRLIGRDQLLTIRVAFFVCAVLTVVAIYLLIEQLTGSVLAGVAGAAVFLSFFGFAQDALAGPDAKTPGVLFAVTAMWLAARTRWAWAGCAAALAFLVWQPFFALVLVVLIAAAASPGRRRAVGLALAGAAVPVLASGVYFAAEGALGDYVESAFQFPVTGVERSKESVPGRLDHIAWVVHHYYKFSGLLFWAGLGLLAAVLVARLVTAGNRRAIICEPVVLVVLLSFLAEAGYAASDFQSYPDLYPLLPYPAVGFGLATALLIRRVKGARPLQGCTAILVAAALALSAYSGVAFDRAKSNNRVLHRQRAMACAVKQVLVPGTPLWSLGDPTPLVMTGRTNPDRFIYLGSGVADWKIQHTAGGMQGWTSEIRNSRASVVISQRWPGPRRYEIERWLRNHGFRFGYIGRWRVFLTTDAQVQATLHQLAVTPYATSWPRTADGATFRQQNCGAG